MSGIYVHAPFCRSKCVYCDYNSYAGIEDLAETYVDACIQQIRDSDASGMSVETIYFGGGNPALLGAGLIKLLDACDAHFEIMPDAEISVEMNPEDADIDHLRRLREAGFNRISLGWQSLDDDYLAMLGRGHDAGAAIRSLGAARRAGFDNINVDLMFGLPGQSLMHWHAQLESIIEYRPTHVSAYALTLETGTPLADIVNGLRPAPIGMPDMLEDDDVAEMLSATEMILSTGGYDHYEISNYAEPGDECRHNLNYWVGGNYLGFGAGAHAHIDGCRSWSTADPVDFISASDKVAGREFLTKDQRLSERLFLGVGMMDGVDPQAAGREFGIDVDETYGDALARMRSLGLITPGPRLALTSRGIPLANEVMAGLI